MMFPREMIRSLVGGLAGLCVAGVTAGARIGDTPDQMESRIVQPDLGKKFNWPKDMRPQEIERERRESPLAPVRYLLPGEADGWREEMFWKSAVKKRLSNEDGWRVHVYYLRGRSVLELYKREGAKLNEFEINGILGVMRTGQTWRRVEGKKDAKEAADDPVLGYEFESGESDGGGLRARQQGDWLLIYDRRLDDLLLERKRRWDANEELRKAEERQRNVRSAPVSVDGF